MANNTYDAYVIGYGGVYVQEYEEDLRVETSSRIKVTPDLQAAQVITHPSTAEIILNGVRKVPSFDHFVLIKVEVTVTLTKKVGSLG